MPNPSIAQAPRRHRRANATVAAVEAFFAVMWFGWGQDGAPKRLVLPLALGSGLGGVVLIVAIVSVARGVDGLPARDDPSVKRRYWITVGVECAAAAAGVAVLAGTGQMQWLPVWVAVVVGVHFFPMSVVLAQRSLVVLGVAILAVCGVALVSGTSTDVRPGPVTGAGACLLVAALVQLSRRSNRVAPRTGSVDAT